MVGLFEMSGAEVDEEELVAACQDVMAAIDKDGDGEVGLSLSKLHDCQHHWQSLTISFNNQVTREEWVNNAMQCEFVASLLAADDDKQED